MQKSNDSEHPRRSAQRGRQSDPGGPGKRKNHRARIRILPNPGLGSRTCEIAKFPKILHGQFWNMKSIIFNSLFNDTIGFAIRQCNGVAKTGQPRPPVRRSPNLKSIRG